MTNGFGGKTRYWKALFIILNAHALLGVKIWMYILLNREINNKIT